MRIKIDWPNIWYIFEYSANRHIYEKEKEKIEQLVDEQIAEQIEMSEVQYPPNETLEQQDGLTKAALKAQRTGSQKDLQEYLKLRKEYKNA